MQHVMIDLETMGLRPTSAIVSIGVVHFDQTNILSDFYTPVSLASCIEHGLTTDPSTVDWWHKQSVEAQAAWRTPDAPSLMQALTQLHLYLATIGHVKHIAPWGNGADFDLVLLKNAYEAVEVEPYWMYYNQHCFRTMKNVFKVSDMPRQGTHHNALDDARHQALWLQRILAIHKITLP